jgi:Na+:H+ antiporter, NhaA family
MGKKTTIITESIVEPLRRFIKIESSSGIILIIAAAIALIWANSPLSGLYHDLFNYELAFRFGNLFDLHKPLILWINDGLMAVFFFVVGLEIKREVMLGELSSFKKASLPIFAAIGGMAMPALLFVFLHAGRPGIEGWGIPMATDIAFSLGVLALLGKRVPVSLKIFLTAFAIVDDIGAVMVIATVYSSQIYISMLLIALGIFVVLYLLILAGLRSPIVFIIAGGIIWYFFLKSGLHPTIAGVMLAFIVPANRKVRVPVFNKLISRDLKFFCNEECEDQLLLNNDQLHAIDRMSDLVREVQSPLQALEHRLHGFVSYFIMPVFALANAGVTFAASGNDSSIGFLSLNIALALIFGKLTGIMLFSFIGVKMKLATLPANINWYHIAGTGLIGGIGFTMSLFISNLAFQDPMLMNHAKIGIIFGSLVAGLGGFFLLRYHLKSSKDIS